MNDTIEQQILFIENMTMYEPHEFSLCNIHVIPLTDNDNDFNPLMPGGNKKVTYTLTNLQLKAPRPSPFPPPNRHISQLKKFFEKYNCELIYAVLRYFILIVMWIQPIFSFTELVTCNLMQICSWIFSKHF